MKPDISAIVIAKNAEKTLKECFDSIDWVKEIIYVDNDSKDKSLSFAKKYTKKVYKFLGGSFSERKNFAVKKSTSEWLLFIDSDERVDEKLKDEIIRVTNRATTDGKYFVFAIPRKNIILGKEMKYGGWYPDYVIRIFRRDKFIRFSGELHEQPEFKGELAYLLQPLTHVKHDNLTEMVEKTNEWSEIEAKLMLDANHPQMNLIRFFTAMFREFWLRMIKNQAYRDGTEGIIYALYQVYSRFISYAKLWELQENKK